MDKRVILSVAGSGKTYHICNEIDETKRNIIIAYTNQNIKNIYTELIKRFGYIPSNTLVMTFHSFLYKFIIRPYDTLIGNFYGIEKFVSKGVTLESSPPPSILLKNGIRIKNPNYNTIDKLSHFVKNNKYYCDLLSSLVIKTNDKKKFSIIEHSCNNLNKFFDKIYIDEVQDFREDNWKVLLEIIKRANNILMVGDYYQHSVNALNNHGIPFQIRKNLISYEDYLNYLSNLGLEVDVDSLKNSRRCSNNVCQYITQKLGITISHDNENIGKIIFVNNQQEICDILENDNIVKLVREMPEIYNFNAITWGYSKGDTYESTCLILSDSLENLNDQSFSPPINTTLNKLYVALTRSKGNVYIIKKADFDLVAEKYMM